MKRRRVWVTGNVVYAMAVSLPNNRRDAMYIGIGTVVLILLIVLLVRAFA